jgi:hypothetical protein
MSEISKEAIEEAQEILNAPVDLGTKDNPRLLYTPHGFKKVYEDQNGKIVCEDAE